MLVIYCSNGSNSNYGPTVLSVEAAMRHDEAALVTYVHQIARDIEPDDVWGCPGALVIDISGPEPVVRPKGEAELAVDARAMSNEAIYASIRELEATQTPRRMRDAALTDEGRAWLAALKVKIDTLRESVAR